MHEYLKYLAPHPDITTGYEYQCINAIRDFVLQVPTAKETHYHDSNRYYFYFSGNSSKYAPIPFPYEGFIIFNPTHLENRISSLIIKRLRAFKYILPSYRYLYEKEQLVNYISTQLVKIFLLKLRAIIIDVINNNIAQDYNKMSDYVLLNKILFFDFNAYAQNVKFFIRNIKLPSYDKIQLEIQLKKYKNIFNRFLGDKKELKKQLLEIFFKEWTLYQQSAILVYYLKMFKIEPKDLINKKTIQIIKDYSRISLHTLQNKDYAEKLLYDYYFNDLKIPGQLFQHRSYSDFLAGIKHFKTINFNHIDQFNIFQFNIEDNQLKNRYNRDFDYKYSIDLNYSIDIHKLLKLLDRTYNDEEAAFLENHTWDNLDGRSFEFEVLNFFRTQLGLNGHVTKSSGDKGIDLVISGEIAIQCKNQNKNISSPVMREFVGSCANSSFKTKIFIAAIGYTTEAKLVAAEHKIILLTTGDLINVIKKHQTKEQFLEKLNIKT